MYKYCKPALFQLYVSCFIISSVIQIPFKVNIVKYFDIFLYGCTFFVLFMKTFPIWMS